MLGFFYVTSFLGVFCEERRADYFYPSVNRAFDVLCFRHRGQARFYSKGNEYTVRVGQVILIPRGVEYAQRGEVDECIVAIHFLADRLPSDRIVVLDPDNQEAMGQAFDNVLSCYNEGGYSVSAALMVKLYSLLEHLCSSDDHAPASRIDRALAVFDAHYNSVDFSVGQWATLLGVSRTTLQKLCDEQLKLAPCAYLRSRRLEDAKKILLSSNEKIKSIAKMCGYYSEKRFSTAFSEYEGCSPQEYRSKHRYHAEC